MRGRWLAASMTVAAAGVLGFAFAAETDTYKFKSDGKYECSNRECSGTWEINEKGEICIKQTLPEERPMECRNFADRSGKEPVPQL
jgi:hypothetical protein